MTTTLRTSSWEYISCVKMSWQGVMQSMLCLMHRCMSRRLIYIAYIASDATHYHAPAVRMGACQRHRCCSLLSFALSTVYRFSFISSTSPGSLAASSGGQAAVSPNAAKSSFPPASRPCTAASPVRHLKAPSLAVEHRSISSTFDASLIDLCQHRPASSSRPAANSPAMRLAAVFCLLALAASAQGARRLRAVEQVGCQEGGRLWV